MDATDAPSCTATIEELQRAMTSLAVAATDPSTQQCLPDLLSPASTSDRDLDALCLVLGGMSLEALQSLKHSNIWWLPTLTGVTREQAVISIRLALAGFHSYKYRSQCLASLYCCLSERQALLPWRRFQVGVAKAPFTGMFVLHNKLVSLWQYMRGYAMAAMLESADTIYACVVGKDERVASPVHEVICLSVHRSQPYLFVYVQCDMPFAVRCLKNSVVRIEGLDHALTSTGIHTVPQDPPSCSRPSLARLFLFEAKRHGQVAVDAQRDAAEKNGQQACDLNSRRGSNADIRKSGMPPSLMTDRDLDVLCDLLSHLSPEAVLSLNETGIWWLPALAGKTHTQAVALIRRALEVFLMYDVRTFCVAWLYCYLSERQLIRHWQQYRVGTSAVALTGDFVLHKLLASALLYLGGHTMGAYIERSGFIYACVMARHHERPPLQHDVFCFSVSCSSPYLYVQGTISNPRFIDALRLVLQRDPARVRDMYLGELRFAFTPSSPPRTGAYDDDELGFILHALGLD
ncbi:hypothetical protein HPB50_007647 [Hyalomma asiaticum]|uniref:Uncharacterized protein n=1 Tax=Hyalomma asiaticum TaxID=266040 RepID=A0ACB7RL17_HYAAI|nr:hypothetical protein HPB50_007647 [Hyalomma asiaticum]